MKLIKSLFIFFLFLNNNLFGEFKNIIFDIHGVLIKEDAEKTSIGVFQEVCRRLSKKEVDIPYFQKQYNCCKDILYRLLKQSCPLCEYNLCSIPSRYGIRNPHLLLEYNKGNIEREKLILTIENIINFNEDFVLRNIESIIDFDTFKIISKTYFEVMTDVFFMSSFGDLIPEVVDILDKIKRNKEHSGVKLYIMSDTIPGLFEKYLEKYPKVFCDFDGVINSDTAHALKLEAAAKINTRVFECLIEKFGGSPKDYVLVDDRLCNVEVAFEFGMNAFWLDTANSFEESIVCFSNFLKDYGFLPEE